MRKLKVGLLLFLVILLSNTVSYAKELEEKAECFPVKVYINGVPYNRPNEAYLNKGRTYVRADIVEKVFSLKSSSLEKKRFQLKGRDFNLILPLDKPGGTFNGDLLPMIYSVQIQDGFVYYPLKLLSEKQDYSIQWYQKNQLVECSSKKDSLEKNRGLIVYDSGAFSLRAKDKEAEDLVFLDKDNNIEIHNKNNKVERDSCLGKIIRTKTPSVSNEEGLFLGTKSGDFYEFHWDKNSKKESNKHLRKEVENILQTFQFQ